MNVAWIFKSCSIPQGHQPSQFIEFCSQITFYPSLNFLLTSWIPLRINWWDSYSCDSSPNHLDNIIRAKLNFVSFSGSDRLIPTSSGFITINVQSTHPWCCLNIHFNIGKILLQINTLPSWWTDFTEYTLSTTIVRYASVSNPMSLTALILKTSIVSLTSRQSV
jgi:hypothetical protein